MLFECFGCEFLRPLQNTKPSEAQNTYTPKYTPNPLPKPKYRKNTKKLRKPRFLYIFRIFSYFGFGRGFGVYFGVYFGAQRGFVFCRGHTNSQCFGRFLSSKEAPKQLKKHSLGHSEPGAQKHAKCTQTGHFPARASFPFVTILGVRQKEESLLLGVGTEKSAFSKRALHSNMPSKLVPSTFLKHGTALSAPREAHLNKNLAILTCLRQESSRQTKPKKGPKRKVHEFRPFL